MSLLHFHVILSAYKHLVGFEKASSRRVEPLYNFFPVTVLVFLLFPSSKLPGKDSKFFMSISKIFLCRMESERKTKIYSKKEC